MPALDSLRFSGTLQDGMLTLKPLHVGIAGGVASGSITLDARKQAVVAHAALSLREAHIEKLFPKLIDLMAPGPVAAQVNLTGQGESIAAIMGHATGSVAALMDGGSISNRLDAKLGLNIGKTISLYFRGDRDIPVNCALLAFTFKNGSGVSQVLRLDTGQTQLNGVGAVSMGDESVDLLIAPKPKQPGIFTLHSLIRVRGEFTRPSIALEKSDLHAYAGTGAASRESAALFEPLLHQSAQCRDVLRATATGALTVAR